MLRFTVGWFTNLDLEIFSGFNLDDFGSFEQRDLQLHACAVALFMQASGLSRYQYHFELDLSIIHF